MIEYGIHIPPDPEWEATVFAGHTLEDYQKIARKNEGCTVVRRWVNPWEPMSEPERKSGTP